MQLVDDVVKPIRPVSQTRSDSESKPAENARCIDAAISLMSNIVETACEREHDLSLMRLINLMDLYRTYLQLASESDSDMQKYIASISGPSNAVLTQCLGDTELVSFERFIRDSRLLSMAAAAATQETGEHVVAPAPLSLSAND